VKAQSTITYAAFGIVVDYDNPVFSTRFFLTYAFFLGYVLCAPVDLSFKEIYQA
jgi:hypothetical protein